MGEWIDEAEVERVFTKSLLNLSVNHQLGDYLEFGVCHGTSILCLNRVMKRLNVSMRIFGFDSFQGLPKEADEEGWWKSGMCAADYDTVRKSLTDGGLDWSKAVLEKGWFSDILTESFKEKHNITKASLIMIDCDLYKSAKESLNFCKDLIKDRAIIMFDDWNPLAQRNLGEKKAFDEFLAENTQYKVLPFGSYCFRGNSYGEVFQIIKG